MTKQEFGDWQTPLVLAEEAMARVAEFCGSPSLVLESTCGEGAFLVAAAHRFKDARLLGYELREDYAATARSRLPVSRSTVNVADFFGVDWERELSSEQGHLLVTGNPPWVTNSVLGALGSGNLPDKRNFKRLSGLDAMTGKSNFDVSEWMILKLLAAIRDRRATIAVLCKSAVARKVIDFASANAWNVRPGGLWQIDAKKHFNAAVDAVLFICETGTLPRTSGWPVYASIDANRPTSTMAVINGSVIADADGLAKTAHLIGRCDPPWRSGMKHDCSRVMELKREENGAWRNGLGEVVSIEDEVVFPFLKSSDVAKGRSTSLRGVVVPQRALGEDTRLLERTAPRAWSYLSAHRDALAARKSSIYRGQPEFAIFGIGPYSFAPWKVAISGLYKRYAFALVGPQDGRPVMVDDTCYFLPFNEEAAARRAIDALRSPVAQQFFAARIFWDAKRPISKAILQQLDLDALIGPREGLPQQQLTFAAVSG